MSGYLLDSDNLIFLLKQNPGVVAKVGPGNGTPSSTGTPGIIPAPGANPGTPGTGSPNPNPDPTPVPPLLTPYPCATTPACAGRWIATSVYASKWPL